MSGAVPEPIAVRKVWYQLFHGTDRYSTWTPGWVCVEFVDETLGGVDILRRPPDNVPEAQLDRLLGGGGDGGKRDKGGAGESSAAGGGTSFGQA